MREIEVITEFVQGRAAEVKTLKSDGERLYTGDHVVAEWGNDGIVMNETRRPGDAHLLADLLALQMEKEDLVQRLRRKRRKGAEAATVGGKRP